MESFWPSAACHLDPQIRLTDSREATTVAAVANTGTNQEAFESERGRCWPPSSEKLLLESSSGGNGEMTSRVGVIKIVIVINCNLITFSSVIACNCN